MSGELFDVLIVGAGPAGSNAAATCLDQGLRVVQIDAREFPRIKPCAGGLTPKSLAALQYDIEGLFQGQSGRLAFGMTESTTRLFGHPKPILHFVHRPDFDNRLLCRNLARPGFRFFPGEPALAARHKKHFEVETPNRTLRARQLIGSDGSYGIVNRTFEVTRPRGMATAVEVEVPREGFCRSPDDPRFDFGVTDRGYGWIFPKRDYWSVGVYTVAPRTRGLRKTLMHYLEQGGFSVSTELEVRAHRYPLGGYSVRVPESPVYLTGDAGGFAEAITGEGIYHALESGRLAGVTAAAVAGGRANPQSFYRKLRRRVLWDTLLSWKFAGVFYRHPAGWLRVFRNPLAWRTVLEGYAEGANLASCAFWSGLYFLRSWKPGIYHE